MADNDLNLYIVAPDDSMQGALIAHGFIFAETDAERVVRFVFERLEGRATIFKCNNVDIVWSGMAFKDTKRAKKKIKETLACGGSIYLSEP